jgi:hypothetical protein
MHSYLRKQRTEELHGIIASIGWESRIRYGWAVRPADIERAGLRRSRDLEFIDLAGQEKRDDAMALSGWRPRAILPMAKVPCEAAPSSRFKANRWLAAKLGPVAARSGRLDASACNAESCIRYDTGGALKANPWWWISLARVAQGSIRTRCPVKAGSIRFDKAAVQWLSSTSDPSSGQMI